ncbi:MAG: hypothetical protein ACI841_004016 [Planctomycetota bacterium]
MTNGAFEFDRVEIQQGAPPAFTGSQAARIFAKGPTLVAKEATIDVSGMTPSPHDSAHPDPIMDWDGDGSASLFSDGADFDGIASAMGAPAQGPGV